jgi:hypothetical protein
MALQAHQWDSNNTNLRSHLDGRRKLAYTSSRDFQSLLEFCFVTSKSGKIIVATAERAIDIEKQAFSATRETNSHSWSFPRPSEIATKTDLPDKMSDKFVVSWHVIRTREALLANFLLDGIPGTLRDDYEKKCGGCGIALLQILYKKAATLCTNEITSVENKMHELFLEGLEEVTAASFDEFRGVYETRNNSLPESAALPGCTAKKL